MVLLFKYPLYLYLNKVLLLLSFASSLNVWSQFVSAWCLLCAKAYVNEKTVNNSVSNDRSIYLLLSAKLFILWKGLAAIDIAFFQWHKVLFCFDERP